MKNSINIKKFVSGFGAINKLETLINEKKKSKDDYIVIIIDHFFKNSNLIEKISFSKNDKIIFVDTSQEPKTSKINDLYNKLVRETKEKPVTVVGIGGGQALILQKPYPIFIQMKVRLKIIRVGIW